jgi:hypothetical protein
MTRPSKIWRVAWAAFVLVNLAGAAYAGATGEWTHALVHVGLLVGAWVAWPFASRAGQQDLSEAPPADQRVEYLQQSVDAIALEVERIGEAQRFNEKLRAERVEKPEREA